MFFLFTFHLLLVLVNFLVILVYLLLHAFYLLLLALYSLQHVLGDLFLHGELKFVLLLLVLEL